MTKVTIMLACAAGMSTSLLVTKMQAAADEKGLDAEIFAVPAQEVDDIILEKKVDVFEIGEVNPDSNFYKTIMKEKVLVA